MTLLQKKCCQFSLIRGNLTTLYIFTPYFSSLLIHPSHFLNSLAQTGLTPKCHIRRTMKPNTNTSGIIILAPKIRQVRPGMSIALRRPAIARFEFFSNANTNAPKTVKKVGMQKSIASSVSSNFEGIIDPWINPPNSKIIITNPHIAHTGLLHVKTRFDFFASMTKNHRG